MKLSPSAAAQMYPHLVKVTCEEHGEQSRAKVPAKLKAVFANRDDPGSVCSQCLSEAKKQLAEHSKELRRRKQDEKQAHREALKQARASAVASDVHIASVIAACSDSENVVKEMEKKLADTRAAFDREHAREASLKEEIDKLTALYHSSAAKILTLSELTATQFDALEDADTSVTSCYNDLREALDSADQLWESVGKAARKKRDKTNKKAAITLLRARDEQANTDGRV